MGLKSSDTGKLIERYIYAFSRKIPSSQREETVREVRGMIDDMAADMFPDSPDDAASVIAVLENLGDPSLLADRFLDRKKCLIGPDFFPTYQLILKIVIPVTAAGLALALILKGVFEPSDNIWLELAEGLSSMFSAAVQAFAWVTVIFALVEHFSGVSPAKAELVAEGSPELWSTDDLPQIPDNKSVIKRSEPIVGIVFIVILMILLNFAPQFFGIYIADNAPGRFISVFEPENFPNFIPAVNILLCLGIVKEFIKLFEGRYTLRSSFAILFISGISLAMFLVIIKQEALWNSSFPEELRALIGSDSPSVFDITEIFRKLYLFVVVIGIFGFIVENAVNFYKSLRYN